MTGGHAVLLPDDRRFFRVATAPFYGSVCNAAHDLDENTREFQVTVKSPSHVLRALGGQAAHYIEFLAAICQHSSRHLPSAASREMAFPGLAKGG